MTEKNSRTLPENMISIIDAHLPVSDIYLVLREHMVKGRVVPRNEKRHSDCFVCVYGGEAVYHFTTHTITVTEGDVLYIAKGSTYYYDVLTERYDYIYFDFDFLFPETLHGFSESFPMKSGKACIRALFERMNNRWLLDVPGNYEQCMADFYQVYAKLVQLSKPEYVPVARRALSEAAAAYIEQNCTRPDFRVSQVAQAIGCSDVHLRRSFRRDFGTAPVDFARRLRLEKARSLLDNTDYSITRIAEMTGYLDAYYFSSTFRKLVGCTPSEYRRR